MSLPPRGWGYRGVAPQPPAPEPRPPRAPRNRVVTLCAAGAFVGSLLAALDATAVQTFFIWLTALAFTLSLTGIGGKQ